MPHAAAYSCSWERQAAGKQSIRLKCPKSLLLEFNVPERGFVMVHIKRYSFQARYDVSGSSFRVNLGVGFAPLLHGEKGRINVVFKVLDGCFKMFYKEEEEALYQPQISRPDYGRGFYFCSVCGTSFYNADKCPSCGMKTRKEGRKGGNNGDKPRVNLDFGEGG